MVSWCERLAASSTRESSRGTFGVLSVKHRAAIPPPRPLPLERNGPPAAQMFGPVVDTADFCEQLVHQAKQTLAEHRVKNVEEVTVEDIDNDLTVFIIAPWTNEPERWVTAVSDIKIAVDDLLTAKGYSGPEIWVQMISPELLKDKYFPFRAVIDPQIESDWQATICDKVLDILDSFEAPRPRDCMTSIQLGPDGLLEEGENPATVHIGMDYTTKEADWAPWIAAIKAYFATLPYELGLHVRHELLVGWGEGTFG